VKIDRLRPVSFINTHGETIPPFACMQIVGVVSSGPDLVIQVTKPTLAVISYGSASRFMFNGPTYVSSGYKGGGYYASPQAQTLIFPSANIGTSNFFQFASPVPNQWYLDSGWIYEIMLPDPIGVHVQGSAVVGLVQPRTQHIFRLVTDSIVTEAAGTAEIQVDNGTTFVGSGVTKQVRSMLGDVDIGETCLAVVVHNMLRIIALCEGPNLDAVPYMEIEYSFLVS